MDILEKVRDFKKQMKKAYPDILIGYEKTEGYYRIYYYLENFNIYDEKFNETIGEAIKNNFYLNGIFNIAQTHLNLERAKKYFKEITNKEKKIKFKEKELLNENNEISQKESYFFILNEFIMQNIVDQTFFSSLNKNEKIKKANFNEKNFKYKNENKFDISLNTVA